MYCTSQIQNYLSEHNLRGKMQSAYRSHHSTETALLRVYNDLLLAADKGHEVILILLDYSAAFDTINHQSLFDRFNHKFGFKDTALSWIKSYFTNRTQSIINNGSESSVHIPKEGVPQGSVLGPLAFTMYSSPLEDIIDAHCISKMTYADDSQLYIMLNNDSAGAISKLEACIKDIKTWSTSNDLKLNDDKTEVLHIPSRFRNINPISSVNINESQIEPVSRARNLGVILQNNLSMDTHINNICRSASHALYKIGQIRRYLDQPTTERLVHAFVTCRLDNCNSLLYGLPECHISKLQRIQNSAARLVTLSKIRCHITPVLRDLHWLPIKARIIYKILLLTFKCSQGFAPIYLQDLIRHYKPTQNLRSASKHLLAHSASPNTSYGRRSFQVASFELWNDLPQHVKSAKTLNQFKSALKTHLFSIH